MVTFIIYKLTSDDKIVSPWIEKECRKCTFLNDFREANEHRIDIAVIPSYNFLD